MTLNTSGEPFRITPATRIVVADGATAQDKQGAELLRREIKTRFNLDVPLVRARDASVRQGVNVIAIGDGERNTVLTRALPSPTSPKATRFWSPRAPFWSPGGTRAAPFGERKRCSNSSRRAARTAPWCGR
jgi:hypothetical protein